jgi:hypothetical protein
MKTQVAKADLRGMVKYREYLETVVQYCNASQGGEFAEIDDIIRCDENGFFHIDLVLCINKFSSSWQMT